MAWLTDWKYRKPITLSRASGAVTNYQMKLLVGESAGATGEDVDCGGKCLSTFNDLRFTAADGFTLLDYWVESLSGTTPNQLATIWIEFDSIGTSATTFYVYYGKSDAAAVSNGANTFIVFDDFERGSNNDAVGGDWIVKAGSTVISTEQAYSGTRSGKLVAAATIPELTIALNAASCEYAIQCRLWKTDIGEVTPFGHGNGSKRIVVALSADEIWQYWNGSAFVSLAVSGAHSQWIHAEIANIDFLAGTADLYYNGSLIAAGVPMHDPSTALEDINRIRGTNTTNGNSWIDNFIVRNWRSTEPAWGSWGSEEEYRAFKSMLILTGSGWREARGI